ncbi:transient receptor potential cation channel subfamily M member-like 2 [Branchiostoma floridae]|uniref:Transient receptor potential cation channel subfamily M member-like 2 n=1 Tax=Branchiostoma floridae TaxID=7739 RepID=A0A9J7KAS3_BRAFL|nr:transient receptor potential cation channel subfamily M member-like 2 [Branchiostoma floridae]
MDEALLSDDPEAVQKELDGGLQLSEYLNRGTLQHLYNKAFEDATPKQREAYVFNNLVDRCLDQGKYEGHTVLHVLGEVISQDLIQDYEIPNIYDDDNADRPLGFHDLLLWAIATGRVRLSRLFWNLGSDQIVSGLVASMMFKFAAEHLPNDIYHADQRSDLFKLSKEYQELAFFVIKECYRLDKKETSDVLVRQRRDWVHIAPLDAVDMAEDMEVMSHAACQFTLNNIWTGRMASHTPTWKLVAATICPPVLFFLEYVEEEDPAHEHEHELSLWDKVKFYFTAPVTKFMHSVVSHVLLILIFSYMVLFELRPLSKRPVGWAEGLMVFWIAVLGLEEIREMVDKRVLIQTWISNVWNFLDVIIVGLFQISFVVRLCMDRDFEKQNFQIIRILYCLTLIFLCVRIIPMFYLSKNMGPKIVMIRKMVGDVVFFLSVLVVVAVCYGVTRLALTAPKNEFSPGILGKVFLIPYWQLHEQMLDLEEGEGPDLPWYVDFLEAGYMLLVAVMLVELQVGLFEYTIERVQERSETYWSYYRYDMIQEYQDRPLGPGPFLLFGLLWKQWELFTGIPTSSPFRRTFSGKVETKLCELERKAVSNVQMKLEKGVYKLRGSAEHSSPEAGVKLGSLRARMSSMEGEMEAIKSLLQDYSKK